MPRPKKWQEKTRPEKAKETLERLRARVDREREMFSRMEKAVQIYRSMGVQGSLERAAKAAGVSQSGLRFWMVRHDVPRNGPRKLKNFPDHIQDEMVRLHHSEHKSLGDIGKIYNISRDTVRRIIRERGGMTRNPREARRALRDERDKLYRYKVEELYLGGFPIAEIAEKLKTSPRRVRRIVAATRKIVEERTRDELKAKIKNTQSASENRL